MILPLLHFWLFSVHLHIKCSRIVGMYPHWDWHRAIFINSLVLFHIGWVCCVGSGIVDHVAFDFTFVTLSGENGV